ncbi:MAG: DUF4254 domain-containing protein [Planctomycetes bacterium]|nr:DUF4254 domain-containing protein [Planctomycetota bacterium]
MTDISINSPDLFAAQIAAWQDSLIEEWHNPDGTPREPISQIGSENGFYETLREQHRRNCLLWHEEDKARDTNASDSIIADVKRRIDKYNQQRNDRIEKLDELVLGMLIENGNKPAPDAEWNSETPGSIMDRLSILGLKVKHTGVQAVRTDASEEHLKKAADRLAILKLQRADLTTALARLLAALAAGKKMMKLYKQFKMYNDPEWNPAVYRKGE